ncbi:coiled-coil domain-containing protein [Mycoplasma sp. 005V]|uniref:coiled-coil domain-containing protein n=1 Tax=Mycoplasma sp. 005V TaxID=3398776 RepID=UPI003A84DB8B
MKKIYRNLLLTSVSLSSVTLPLVASSCTQTNTTTENENNLINTISAYRNTMSLYVDGANTYFTKLIINTKNDPFLSQVANKYYGELSLSVPDGKLKNDFFDYYNNIKNVTNLSVQMKTTANTILDKISKVDIAKPIDFYRNVIANHKQLGEIYNQLIQTYGAIIGQAEKINQEKANEYKTQFVKNLEDGPKKVFEFSLITAAFLQLEIKNYGISDMLQNLEKSLKEPNAELQKAISDTNSWVNKWLKNIESYTLDKIQNEELNLEKMISEINTDFENTVTKTFYTKFMVPVLQQRQPEKELTQQFNQNPIYFKFYTSTTNNDEIQTANQLLKQEEIAKNKTATDAIEKLVSIFTNHGKNLNPSYPNDNFANGEAENIKFAFLTQNGKQETDEINATIYTRDNTTKKFASKPNTTNGLAQTFDASNTNYVIKVNVPQQLASTLGLVVPFPQNNTDIQEFYKNTNGYLPFGIRGLSAIKNSWINPDLLVFDTLFAGLEGNRTLQNQWDNLIFENYNFVFLNQNSQLNIDAYIGISDEIYNKFFANKKENEKQAEKLAKDKKQLEDQEMVLDSKYQPWVKNFLIPKYQANSNTTEEQYYKDKLAQIITVKEGKNYITVDKWIQALQNILDYLAAAPNKDQTADSIQKAVKDLEAQKDSLKQEYDKNMAAINSEKEKQQAIVDSKEATEQDKEQAKKALEQLKEGLSQLQNNYDKNVAALDYQITQAKITIQDWINSAKAHGLNINQYSDIETVKTEVTTLLNTAKKQIDEINKQIDKLLNFDLLSILFRLQNVK